MKKQFTDMRLFWVLCLVMMVWPMTSFAQLYDLVVAKDGSGNFTNIQDAVNAIRDYKPEGRQRILVRKGVYEEKLVIPSYKTNISLIGEDRDSTILVWHDHAGILDAAGRKLGTFRSYTMLVNGPGFECENMTISNDAMTYYNPTWMTDRKNTAGVAQAVALHVEGDRAVFRNCRLLGFQDTVFNGNEDSRQMFYKCYIEGTVDFIFGPATCWFEQCHLHAISRGYITAASTPADHPYGYIFNRCRVTTDSLVKSELLGRPWRNYAAVIFKECELPATINPVGWNNWRDPAREKTARYAEYKCFGPGADRSKRVAWSRELTDAEAEQITLERVFSHAANVWHTTAFPLSFSEVSAMFLPEGKFASRYVAGTLENDTEELVVNLNEVDCTTFVEYVTASLLSRQQPCVNDSVFERFLTALRYTDGKVGNYASRKHYMSHWIADNVAQGMMYEVTGQLKGVKSMQKRIDYMSKHAKDYASMANDTAVQTVIGRIEAELSNTKVDYIPKSQVGKVVKDLLPGDIVCLVTKTKGLDIQHVGFATKDNADTVSLMHASSKAGKVVVEPLEPYIRAQKNCIGIRVVRLCD